jgi:PAS domain S-box-containing protein
MRSNRYVAEPIDLEPGLGRRAEADRFLPGGVGGGAPGESVTSALDAPGIVGLPAPFEPDTVGFSGWNYRQLFDALGVAVYTTDPLGRITFYNEAAVELWGRRPQLGEEWCGSWKLYWPDGRPMAHVECPMAIALKEQRIVRGGEAWAERPDGTRVAFTPFPTPLFDRSGEMVGAVNVLVDVTERRQAADALAEAAQALRASNAVKDDFLGLVSHELRTPVTTILGNSRLLRDRWTALGDDVKASMIGDIADDSERLVAIIENLLLLTKLESGAEPDLEPQVLGRLVASHIGTFGKRHPEREIVVHDTARRAVICADATYVAVLLDNLLGNAAKYSQPSARIDVSVAVQDGEAHVSVADRGIGMTIDEASRLFTPFYRTEAAKAQASGLGIGLATCKRLIETLHGRITAEPRHGGGLVVSFALPLLDPELG